MQSTPKTLKRLFAFVLLGVSAFAQAPKSGSYFVDDTDLGFKVKVPKNWDFLPGAPNKRNVIGVFAPTKAPYINLSGTDILFKKCWLLRFDKNREHTDYEEFKEQNDNEEEDRAALIERHKYLNWKNLETWVEANRLGIGISLVEEDEYTRVKGIPARSELYLGRTRRGSDIHVWSVLYEVSPDTEVALVFMTPADVKAWKKWERALDGMARTFKRVKLKEVKAVATNFGASQPRAAKRAKLEDEIRRQVGWQLHESPNYFIVTSMDESKLSGRKQIEELQVRLEAIRQVYEQDYPPESVAATLLKRTEYRAEEERKRLEEEAEKKAEEGDDYEGDEEGDEEEEDEQDDAPRTEVLVDPMEASRASVVRVCATSGEYHSYGGPGGSAGFWSPVNEELVFSGQASGGDSAVWIVLNHEAFHQYIYYFYGQISPHSWYNEGTGDFYSGYQLDNRHRFHLKPNSWRLRTIQVNIRSGDYAPLRDLVRWTQAEYYGSNDLRLHPGANYAQGWSFIYFLRTGKEARVDGWNEEWEDILSVYLETLAITGDLDKAVDEAFEDVDYMELEKAWKEFVLDI